MVNEKVIIINLSWIDKKRFSILSYMFKTWLHLIEMSQYFPKPYEPFGGNINVKVDLSNYATKGDIKNISHVDWKTEVDKLDINKLVAVCTDLSKLSNVVTNEVVKKYVYDKLVK